ncbi:hypothetical protein BOTNAR_0244g00150 [Botryotinia narcissicola]|uniref:Uncharacterized protein n=1 Tax=Botryotinia narcissicola TaxID=278944 RepID=A0A4Z1I2G5_9HELO|nr:hypothetical protein BOTNAR_0244g00150 [Botryotinia narcissicola]
MAPIPAQLRDDIKTRLEKVMEELEAHPSWSLHNTNSGLFFLWDFVKRGTGEDAALKVFQEVCARALMLNMIVTDTSVRMRMMMGSAGNSVDYGEC